MSIPHSTPTPPAAPEFRRAYLPGVALYSACGILVQLLLTRLFSITVGYHFAFMVISIVMLSLAAPGAILYAFPRLFPPGNLARQLAVSSLLFGGALVGVTAFYLAVHLPVSSAQHNWWLRPEGKRNLVIIFAMWIVPFLAGGFVPALLLGRFPDRAPTIYGWDLVGAAFGGVAYVLLLRHVSGVTALILSGAVLALCAAMFADPAARRARTAAVLCAAAILAIATGNAMLWPNSPVRIRYAKYYVVPPALLERWTPISRITVHDPADLKITRPESGFGWSLSPKYKGPVPEELWIEQDAAAGTPITAWDGSSTATVDHLLHDLTALPHRIRRPRGMFVIGPGGGRDVLAALVAGADHVTAVEMNPATVDIMKGDLAGFSGNLYNHPRVEVIVGEGRSVLRASGKRFDTIQVSLIDSLAATATGALVFVENTLYTREAFETYLDHLSPDGVLTMSWWYLGKPPGVAYRVLLASLQALQERGVTDPSAHILLARSGTLFNLMVKRSPWTAGELAKARSECAQLGFEILLQPGVPSSEPELDELARDPAAVLARHDLNLRAATDDSPFIFQLQKWGADYTNTAPENLVFLAGTRILGPLLILMAFAGAVLVILPLVHRASRGGRGAGRARQPWIAAMIAATGCGLGYITVEITLMHYGTLFVGYPVYALVLVLVAMLLGSGIGSVWSARFAARPLCLRLVPVMLGLACLLYLATLGAHTLFGPSAHWPWAGRAALVCGVSLLLGALMGLPFPTLMRVLGSGAESDGSSNLLPWLWGVNGVAGVLASVLVMYIAVFLGHTAAMLAASGCYVAVAVALWWIGSRRPAPAAG